jgi:hypothetical protein
MPGNRHMNWKPIVWTPGGVSPIPLVIDGVQGFDLDFRGNIVTHMGDADAYPTMKTLANSDPMFTCTNRDMIALHSLPPGTRGTSFAGTHRDARMLAAAGGGGYTATMSGPIVEGNTAGGAYATYGEGRVMVSGESADGITSPVTFTLL